MAALAYKRVTFEHKMADDAGSGAKTDLATWAPILEEGWYYLGQSPTANHTTPPTGIIIQAKDPKAVVEVAAWEPIWDDAGSGKKKDYALWRGIAPSADYIVLGGIFSTNPGYAPPDATQARGIVAVRGDLVVPDDTKLVWTDAGSKARKDGSVWTTAGTNGISPNVLIPVLGHSAPFPDRTFSLNPAKLEEL
ncbi:FDS protein [Mycena galericulata]|nr:FDS protein [Mycena galericulata]